MPISSSRKLLIERVMVGTIAPQSNPVLIEHPLTPNKKRSSCRFERICAFAFAPSTLFVLIVFTSVFLALRLKTWNGGGYGDGDGDSVSALIKSAMIAERPFRQDVPRWCSHLITSPRERPRTSAIYDCRRGRFGAVCEDGRPAFFSQYNQDMWTYTQHWRHLKRPGVYLDIAANEPVRISNTYFYDRCLRWRGLCVEPNLDYTQLLIDHRSCAVLPMCVSNKFSNDTTFALDAGSSGVLATNKNEKAKKSGRRVKVHCVPTSKALKVFGLIVIDMLSLDVEGHEHFVLEGIDWKHTRINVIVIESVSNRTLALLRGLGYKRVQTPNKKEMSKPGALLGDFVFIHPAVRWGDPNR